MEIWNQTDNQLKYIKSAKCKPNVNQLFYLSWQNCCMEMFTANTLTAKMLTEKIPDNLGTPIHFKRKLCVNLGILMIIRLNYLWHTAQLFLTWQCAMTSGLYCTNRKSIYVESAFYTPGLVPDIFYTVSQVFTTLQGRC